MFGSSLESDYLFGVHVLRIFLMVFRKNRQIAAKLNQTFFVLTLKKKYQRNFSRVPYSVLLHVSGLTAKYFYFDLKGIAILSRLI